MPRAGTVGPGPELEDLRLQMHLAEQLVDAEALLGRNLGTQDIAAEFLHHDLVLQQFLLHAFGGGIGQVDLVDRHDDGHPGGLGVADGLHRLGHHAVVGGHDQDHDVGDLGAAGAHGRKGRVTGRVQEGDGTAVGLHGVGADVLGDTAGLTGDDVGLADAVQQRGLAVVDVAHDRDHGRPVGLVLFLDGSRSPERPRPVRSGTRPHVRYSAASSSMLSFSSRWLMVAMMPILNRWPINSWALTPQLVRQLLHRDELG